MLKGLFFTTPSESVNNTLVPIIDMIASNNFDVIFYNTFKPKGNHWFSYKAYPPFDSGYDSNWMKSDSSYYQLADVLMNTTVAYMDFLINEVEKENPDFIMHSHLSVWGKILANHLNIPAIMLCTTFVMDKRVMIPCFKPFQIQNDFNFTNINYALTYLRSVSKLKEKFNIKEKLDIWDAYVNKENLNIVFILNEFQPKIELFLEEFNFLGPPFRLNIEKKKKNLIYVSLGTILNDDIEFYNLCIKVLKLIKYNTVLSIGKNFKIDKLDNFSSNINIKEFVDQVKILKKAKLFITSGGMASVNEAIVTMTPMIIIPQTTEQKITAKRIEELGIGIYLKRTQLTEYSLSYSIHEIMLNYSKYYKNISLLSENVNSETIECKVLSLINSYLT